MILDRLETHDGHTIYWVHETGENTIYEEDLFHCEYNLMDFISDKLRSGDWDIDDIVNHCECTIDLIDLHKEVLLEDFEHVIRYDDSEHFKGIDGGELLEMCEEFWLKDEDEKTLDEDIHLEDIDVVIGILEDNIKGIEIES